MQDIILEKLIFYAPIGIFAALLLLAVILAANLRQMKKLNRKMNDTLNKADAYFHYILEEEEEEEEEGETQSVTVAAKASRNTKKAEDAALLQDVLMEYFP